MRLAYITNVKIPAADAQSLQIAAMAKSFFMILQRDFLLVSPKNDLNTGAKTDYEWTKITAPLQPRWLRYIFTILFSVKPILKFKPNIIYSRDILVVFFYKLLGYNVAYEIHKPFETFIGNLLFKLLSKYIKIITISQALKDFIVSEYDLDESSILVAHDGVFVEEFLKLNKEVCRLRLVDELGLVPQSFVALYSGNLQVGGKGTHLILEAARRLPDINFVILGGGKFFELDVPKNIHFVARQPVSEIPRYLKGANILLLPFTKELKTYKYHSALKIFEYMASGVPIIASDLGSIKEVLNTSNAFLFNPEDSSDLVLSLSIAKKDLLEGSGRASKALQDVKNYDWLSRSRLILKFLFS